MKEGEEGKGRKGRKHYEFHLVIYEFSLSRGGADSYRS